MSKQTDPVPLFTLKELAIAFSLLVPESRAMELAREWFGVFVDPENVDGAGRYLYRDWADHAALGAMDVAGGTIQFKLPAVPSNAGIYDWLTDLTGEELEERLLSFSDFTLDLVALSSPKLMKQVKFIRRREPQLSTEDHCRELQRAIDRMIK